MEIVNTLGERSCSLRFSSASHTRARGIAISTGPNVPVSDRVRREGLHHGAPARDHGHAVLLDGKDSLETDMLIYGHGVHEAGTLQHVEIALGRKWFKNAFQTTRLPEHFFRGVAVL